MALAKQTLTLILISTHIIFATCKDAQSTPDTGHTHSETEEAKPAKESSNASNPSLTEKKETKGKEKKGKQDDVANVVAKQMQAVQKKIEDFNASLKKRLDNPGSSPGSHECVSECDEVFGAAIDDIQKTLDSLQSQNLMKANFDVSAVSTNVDTCNDCFEEMVGGDPEVKKLGDWVRKITGDALEALQKADN